jgi:hypothetical protein
MKMFANLMSLAGLDHTKVQLMMQDPEPKPYHGPHAPRSVDDLELTIPYEWNRLGDTASCAGGGHGIGDGG